MRLVGGVLHLAAALALFAGDGAAEPRAIQVALSRVPRERDASRLLAHGSAASASAPSTPHVDAAETRMFSGEGSHTVRVLVGGQARELIVDTGSGKTAFICAGCRSCGGAHANPPFEFTAHTAYAACDLPPEASSALSLFSFALPEAQRGTCTKCLGERCAYSQTYVEGDYWAALKVRDELELAPAFRADVDFGCIYEQTGVFNAQSSDGIMGFSRHADAVFEQFHRRGVTKSRIFSQCLGAQGGMLTLGGVDLSINYAPVRYTPVRDTGYQYWTVTLLRVRVGAARVELDSAVYNKDRGCVLDSGTTFVYLPEAARGAVRAAWRAAVGDDWFPESGASYSLAEDDVARLPSICFLFLNDAELCMSAELYLFRSGPRRFAGTLFFSDNAKSTIIGASALTGHNVIYDIDNGRVGMAPANCEAPVATGGPEALVELSTSPGGDTFRAVASPLDGAAQLLLPVATLLAIAGLVHVVWAELRDGALERKLLSTEEGDDELERGAAYDPPIYSPTSDGRYDDDDDDYDDDDDDGAPSAFGFMLMSDDEDLVHDV